jgi:hypothetical protein
VRQTLKCAASRLMRTSSTYRPRILQRRLRGGLAKKRTQDPVMVADRSNVGDRLPRPDEAVICPFDEQCE